MMLLEVMKPGEKVKIDVSKESKSWGYNPAPNGTEVKITSFAEIHYGRSCGFIPGVYVNHHWVNIELPDKRSLFIGSHCLSPIDKKEYNNRLNLWKENRKPFRKELEENRLRDLPDTTFWEGDVVKCNRSSDWLEKFPKFVISTINYGNIGQFCEYGVTFMPLYEISDKIPNSWSSPMREEDLELVERGNIWKHHHGITPVFKDIQEEADFYKMVGETEEVRNPKDNLFHWSLDEALKAIKDGIGHCINMSRSISVLKYDNQEVGKRIADTTLEGFKDRM